MQEWFDALVEVLAMLFAGIIFLLVLLWLIGIYLAPA